MATQKQGTFETIKATHAETGKPVRVKVAQKVGDFAKGVILFVVPPRNTEDRKAKNVRVIAEGKPSNRLRATWIAARFIQAVAA